MQHRSLSIVAALVFAAVAGCSDSATKVSGPESSPTTGALARKPAGSPLTTPVSGTVAGVSSFAGNLTITGFQVINGQLMAVGTLTGQLTNLVTGVVNTVTATISTPVAPSGSCEILHLELGPLDLNLLGLQVHLDRVVLDVTAQQGSGNLLGNLLCAIANLLNGGGALTSIAALLNQIVALLGGV